MKHKIFISRLTSSFIILALSLLLNFTHAKDTFSQISPSIFNNIKCVPYAYGDFNADKRVDIFCVSSGTQAEIWQAQEKEPLFGRAKAFSLRNQPIIKNIVPGDFNGDSIMDLLIVSQANQETTYKMSFFRGEKSSKYSNDLSSEIEIDLSILGQPFVADFNGDGKLDILVETGAENNATLCFITFDEQDKYLIDKTYSSMLNNVKLMSGFAQSVADMNNDYQQDLILVTDTKNKNIPYFQIFTIEPNNHYKLLDEYSPPEGVEVYGQSLFADFDSDGTIEHLLPACKDSQCLKSELPYLLNLFKENDLIVFDLPLQKCIKEYTSRRYDFGLHGFVSSEDPDEFWGKNKISLKAGDYNLNGYVDLMVILKENNSTNSNGKFVYLMNNIEAVDRKLSPNFSRTFKMDTVITNYYNNVVQASFFDLYDDGYLDILLVTKNSGTSKEDLYQLSGLKNEYYDDVYFLKVMVIPGRCGSIVKCPFQSLPYGLNYPGVMVKIETISFDYQKVILYAVQLSQSSYMSLQLPYTIFGLGSTANFVEHLTVGITAKSASNSITSFIKEWPQIIPNSQLVISPSPRYNTYNWKMQLFITPSKNILLTGISLGFTMIVLVMIISMLQLQEKKMDDKERKLESQRFHFDGL